MRCRLPLNRVFIAGILLFAAIVLLVWPAKLLLPSPTAMDGIPLAPPSAAHPLGANELGQDILARVAAGGRTSTIIAVGAGILATSISLVVGCGSALVGGAIDHAVMRMVDVLLVVPGIIVLILVSAYVKPGPGTMILLLSALYWPGAARVIRAQTLSLRQRGHIRAAQALGAGRLYIMRRHILPAILPILTATVVANARRAVFMEAGLAFLGIAQPDMVSWGLMLHHAMTFAALPVWKWWLLPPALALALLVLALALIGVGLEPQRRTQYA